MASVRVQDREPDVADMRPRGFFVWHQSGGVDEDIHAEWRSHGSEMGTQTYNAVSSYGGEEFLAVLNGCSTRVGASHAEKYSARFPRDPVKTATGPVAVPMSLGVAGTEDWQESHAEQLNPLGSCEAFGTSRNSHVQPGTG